ncbi:BREX-6 system phosphatase PglZ [Thiocystis violacea]|uniref:BREX-6 system phosphatase PglZ n=1 Tax=Thiocystis violacea TaxID=13725 RepID=UPI001903B9C7|nr:BREX-6 system phosphatase PglZ [Thiocystis violacea]MBK1717209.1 hypothetical protein [Thiocystis violacea]
MTMDLGPVSSALEAEVRTWVRRHGIVVWLDLDDHYSAFVDRLAALHEAGGLPYEVRAYRGSYLALMLALEGVAEGAERVPLLLHLPGLTEESVRETPLYEFYVAGTRYRKALDTLITEAATGQVRPDQIAAFKTQPVMTLAGADLWLAALLDEDAGEFVAALRAMAPTAVFDDLLGTGFIAGHFGRPDAEAALWTHWRVWTGLPATWRETTLPAVSLTAGDMAFAVAGWVLCVEYVHDLGRAPVSMVLAGASDLPRGLVDRCHAIAAHLRERHPSFYQRTADETEALLTEEVEAAKAEDLGRIDTFRFEEERVLKAALAALQAADWARAADWAEARVGSKAKGSSFWLRDDPARQSAWQLVQAAARLGQTIEWAGDLGAEGELAAAVAAYTERGAAVDRTHRHLEQRRVALLYPQLPEFEVLRTCLDEMRGHWRAWADTWARAFNRRCRTHGFLPEAASRQRTLFDDVVKPLTRESGTTAYFVVDAFRYEMAEELYRQLIDTPATTVTLKARLAELPTCTEVGMNVLAPVAINGELAPALSSREGGGRVLGFACGEFRVSDPETRQRAMHARVGGGTCPWMSLDEVVTRDTVSLKRAVAQARLVVVHSQEIDEAGEKGVGPAVFDHLMQKLRAAWRLLRDAGVRRFILTADHGFLLLDPRAGAVQAHGRRIDPGRRHVFSPVAADHPGEARVALADLGYLDAPGHLMFPETTALFDIGRHRMSFAHGGNSLQERVIPVLTLVHRAAAGGRTQRYAVSGEAREGVAGMHCLALKVEIVAQCELDFGSPREVELALRVPEVADVRVELCQTRGPARLLGGVVWATVGQPFELFFRLSGPADARVLIELYHPGALAEVMAAVLEPRFAVTAVGAPIAPAGEGAAVIPTPTVGWLEQLAEDGVRQFFSHLAEHGAVTESEAASMLGGPRGLRRFALDFETFVEKAPFTVRIDMIGGVKRYVRE